MRVLKNGFSIGAFFIAVVSLLTYYQIYSQDGLQGVLLAFTDAYRKTLQSTLGKLDPLLEWALEMTSRYLNFHVELPKNWRENFVPAMFYFSRDALVNWRPDRKHYACFLFITGTVVALVFSMAAGAAVLNNSALRLFAAFAAFATLYEVLSALYFAIFIGFEGNSPRKEFVFQFRERARWNIWCGLVVLFGGWFLRGDAAQISAFLLIVYVFVLGIRDMLSSIRLCYRDYVRYATRAQEPVSYRNATLYIKSNVGKMGVWKLGSKVTGVILSTLALIIIGRK
jgi:hypothetical protein